MIELNKLTDADKGRVVIAREEELGSSQKVVLVRWDERFAFVVWPDTCPPSGGYIMPDLLTMTNKRAVLACRYCVPVSAGTARALPRGHISDDGLLRAGHVDYRERLIGKDEMDNGLRYIGTVWRLQGETDMKGKQKQDRDEIEPGACADAAATPDQPKTGEDYARWAWELAELARESVRRDLTLARLEAEVMALQDRYTPKPISTCPKCGHSVTAGRDRR